MRGSDRGTGDENPADRLSACLASSSTLELPLVNLLSAALGKMAKDQLIGPYGTQFNAAYFEVRWAGSTLPVAFIDTIEVC